MNHSETTPRTGDLRTKKQTLLFGILLNFSSQEKNTFQKYPATISIRNSSHSLVEVSGRTCEYFTGRALFF